LIVDDYVAPPKDIWTREIPQYLQSRNNYSPSSSSSQSSQSSSLSHHMSITQSPPQSPAQLKGHLLNPQVVNGEKKEDSSVLFQPSHSVLGHLGIRTTTSDGLLATTVTMRYKHKVRSIISNTDISL
jgi:hypothetical protein